MAISATMKNQGTEVAGNFVMQFCLSTNQSLGGDVPYAFCSVTSLAVDTSVTCSGTVAIPVSIAPGTYFLVVRVDDTATVLESVGNNNIRSSAASFIIN